MNTRWMLTLILTAAVVVPGTIRAQTGAQVLDYPLTTRSQGMGMSGTADRGDPGNVYFNPATAAYADGVWITGAREQIAPTVSNDIWFGSLNLGGGYTLGGADGIRLAFDLGLTRFTYGEVTATTPEGLPLGTFDANQDVVALTGAAAGEMGPAQWAFGVALKRLAIAYTPEEATNWIFDIGAIVGTDMDASDWSVHPAVGAAVVNMGSDIEYDDIDEKDPLPTWFNYGVSVRVDAPEVQLGSNSVPALSATINLDGKHGLNEQRPRFAFGYELTLIDVLFARYGRQTDDRYHAAGETWGIGLGAPVGPLRAVAEYTNTRYAYFSYPYSYASFQHDLYGFTLVWLFDRNQG
jgi:hypothetical protein